MVLGLNCQWPLFSYLEMSEDAKPKVDIDVDTEITKLANVILVSYSVNWAHHTSLILKWCNKETRAPEPYVCFLFLISNLYVEGYLFKWK